MKNIYLCGPTVYDSPHIGNMRPIIVFDIFLRSLKALGEDSRLIHNITDIDDKIIEKSIKEKKSEKEISKRYILEYLNLLKIYNIKKPYSMPKVTKNMDKIINFIEKLILKGYAYEQDGSVYFSINKDSLYGKLSNRNIEELFFKKSDKKYPGDFALWKKTNQGIFFDSPWSKGRPGWHTECAVFIDDELKGESLDIHGGGIDLIFPHHENEASQYRLFNKKEITKKWVHIGQLSINGKKMSKSLNNSFLAIDFANKIDPDVLRMLFLTTSPTTPINLKDELIEQLSKQVKKWKNIFLKAQFLASIKKTNKEFSFYISKWNFSQANKILNKWIKEFNKKGMYSEEIIFALKSIGFNFAKKTITNEDKQLYKEWKTLISECKYDEADKIRKILFNYGFI